MASFGWSAACLVEAIKVINKTRNALKDAGGSASQFQEALHFLSSLEGIFELLKQHVQTSADQCHANLIAEQLKRIDEPWNKFTGIVKKYEKSLEVNSAKSKATQATRKIQWALKKIDDAVRKLKVEIMQHIQAINCILTLSLLGSIRKQGDEPWTADQIKQLLDAIHSAPTPFQLAADLKCLGEAGREQNRLSSECLRLLITLQVSISKIDEALRDPSQTTRTEELVKALSAYSANNFVGNDEISTVLDDQAKAFESLQASLKRELENLRNQSTTNTNPLSIGKLLAFAIGVFVSSCPNGGRPLESTLQGIKTRIPSSSLHEMQHESTVIRNKNRKKSNKDVIPDQNIIHQPHQDLEKQKDLSQHNTNVEDSSPSTAHCCPYEKCPQEYASISVLDDHIDCDHRKMDAIQECPMIGCQSSFIMKDNLARHLRDGHDQAIPQRTLGSRMTPELSSIDKALLKSESPVPSGGFSAAERRTITCGVGRAAGIAVATMTTVVKSLVGIAGAVIVVFESYKGIMFSREPITRRFSGREQESEILDRL